MRRHKPVSHIRWQASQKQTLLDWKDKKLDKQRALIERALLPVLQRYAAHYPEGATVLEIGCGPLCITRNLNGKQITYLDPLIDNFRRMFPGELPDEGEFIASAAENIDKPDASYDLITCLNTLSHALNPELIMNEAERLLKPGGRLILAIRTHNPLEARLHYMAVQTFSHLFCQTRPYYYSLKGILRTLKRHFEIENQIVRKASPIPLPFCTRKLHIFICTKKVPAASLKDQVASKPADKLADNTSAR